MQAKECPEEYIRNVSVIGAATHGKSALTASWVRTWVGEVAPATEGVQFEFDEQRDIKPTTLSIELPTPAGGQRLRLNLVDTPGHVDLSPSAPTFFLRHQVSAALRVTDGALVVVDCVEGIGLQIEATLRQSLPERVKPVLVLNKLDRAILELKLDPQELYERLSKIVESFNAVLAVHKDEALGDLAVQPDLGTVAFTCGLHGWGFTLTSFAETLGKRLGVEPHDLQKRLWGDNFYDADTKEWVRSDVSPTTGKKLQRAFCQFVLGPIYKVTRACLLKPQERDVLLNKYLRQLSITLEDADKTLAGEDLMKLILSKFLPLEKAMNEIVVRHLPSPVQAQMYRVETLYEGPMDDECAEAIRRCDREGPLVVYISKMLPYANDSKFYAFGRVFSGTVKANQQIRILGPDYVPGRKVDLSVVKSAGIAQGDRYREMVEVCAGYTVCLVGIDQYINNSCPVTTSKVARRFRPMPLITPPIVRVAIDPKDVADTPKLTQGLRRLEKTGMGVQCTIDETTGEMIVAGATERHVEMLLDHLAASKSLGGTGTVEFVRSRPTTVLRETVIAQSSQICLSKSPNKHSRIWMTAEPFPEGLGAAIERGTVNPARHPRQLADQLSAYGWDVLEARKIWCWGPQHTNSNALFDITKARPVHEIRDPAESAFQWATRQGVLCEEDMHGIRFNIVDVTYSTDTRFRGAGQVIPMVRRVLYAAQLSAQPRLVEPVYLVELCTHKSALDAVVRVLSERGQLVSSDPHHNRDMHLLKAYLPVAESFNFASYLRAAIRSTWSAHYVFDHWAVMEGDPLDPSSRAAQVVLNIRQSKGLRPGIPSFDTFNDKL